MSWRSTGHIRRLSYAGTQAGIFKSTNSGATWVSVGGDLLKSRVVRSLAVHPVSGQVVYAGSYGRGIYKSTNGGATWKWMDNDFGYEIVWQVAIDPLHPNTVYACVGDAGFYKSTNGGATWKSMGRGGYSTGLAFDPVDSRIVYLLATGFWRSADGGATWTALSVGASPMSLAVDGSRPGVLYTGTYNKGVYKSLDYGATWSAVNTGLNGPEAWQIAVASSDTDTVYAGTAVDGVFRTRNGGASWIDAGKGLSGLQIHEIYFDGVTAGTLFAACCPGIYKCTGGGARWTNLTPASGRVMDVMAAAVHPKNPAILYAAIQTLGLRKSTDGGTTWRTLGLNLRGSRAIWLSTRSRTTGSLSSLTTRGSTAV